MKDTHITRKTIHLSLKTELGWTTTACGLRGWPVATHEGGYMNRWRVFRSSSDEKACTCRRCLGKPLRRKKRKVGPVEVRVKRKRELQDGRRVIG